MYYLTKTLLNNNTVFQKIEKNQQLKTVCTVWFLKDLYSDWLDRRQKWAHGKLYVLFQIDIFKTNKVTSVLLS